MAIRLNSIILGGFLVAATVVGAEAFSVPAATLAANPNILQVRGFCGLGFHRGPYGGCVPNGTYVYAAPAPIYGTPVYVPPPPVVVPSCPRGWYFAYGRCNPY
jgi:hypothetical protein